MCFRPPEAVSNTVPVNCPECGEQNAPDTTTCVFCGADIPLPEPPDPNAPTAPSTVNIGFGIPSAPISNGAGFGQKPPTAPSVKESDKTSTPASPRKWGGAPQIDYSGGGQFHNY